MARFQKLELSTQAQSAEVEQTLQSGFGNWMKRADDCRRSGAYEGALQFYSRALEEDKLLVLAWVGQVQMLVQLHEYPEAEVWSRKALELFPADGDLFAARAQSLGRLNRTKEAFAAIDSAMTQPGLSPYRWVARGELLLSGRQKTDRHCFDKAQQLDADWLVPAEIALIYLHHRQPSNALNRARLATERDPSAAYAWYLQGLSQRELGMDMPAGRSFETCLELSPGFRKAEDELELLHHGGTSMWKRIRGLWSR